MRSTSESLAPRQWVTTGVGSSAHSNTQVILTQSAKTKFTRRITIFTPSLIVTHHQPAESLVLFMLCRKPRHRRLPHKLREGASERACAAVGDYMDK